MKKRFIFDEKYNKKNAKKESLKWLIIGVAVLALIIVIIIIILATRNNKPQPAIPQFELNTELILESGSPLPKVVDYFLKYENIDLNDVKITYPSEFEVSFDTSLCSKAELEEINKQENFEPDDYDCVQSMLKAPNTYGVTISLLEKDYTVNLIVKDTTAPVILTNKVEIYSDQSYSVNDFVKLCFDINDECNVSYYNKDTAGNDFDYSAFKDEGTYTIRLIGTDKFGNVSNPVETELKIIKPVAPIYTVTFNSNGGTSVESLLVEEGNKISEPAMPEKEGYNFLGWYLNNQKYDFSSSVMMNITLIAKWEKVENNTGDGSGNETGGNTGTIKPTIIQVSSLSLNYKKIYLYINDSKQLSEKKREELYDILLMQLAKALLGKALIILLLK